MNSRCRSRARGRGVTLRKKAISFARPLSTATPHLLSRWHKPTMDDPGLPLAGEGLDEGIETQQQVRVIDVDDTRPLVRLESSTVIHFADTCVWHAPSQLVTEPDEALLLRLTRDLLCHQVLPFCARVDVATLMKVGRVEAEYGLKELFCKDHGTRLDASLASAGEDGSACIDCRMNDLGKERCAECDNFHPFEQLSWGACGYLKCRACGPTKECSWCDEYRHDNCTACGSVNTCLACGQTFCERCKDMVVCDGCKTVLRCKNPDRGCPEWFDGFNRCDICGKEYCQKCSEKGVCCDRCSGWYCTKCTSLVKCEECSTKMCALCVPLTCSKCDKSFCFECWKVSTCDECNVAFCDSCRDMGYCECCDACYCADCHSIDACSHCGVAVCSPCIAKYPRPRESCIICNGCMCSNGKCQVCDSENFCVDCNRQGKHTCGGIVESGKESDECHERKKAKTQHSNEAQGVGDLGKQVG